MVEAPPLSLAALDGDVNAHTADLFRLFADDLARRLRQPDHRALLQCLGIEQADAGGRILVLSGKRGYIAEMRLEDRELLLVRVYRIETSKRDVPEGICIDARGHVWICTDGKGMLRQYELTP